MKSLQEYIFENIINIFEVSGTLHKEGINISKYFNEFKEYLDKFNIKILTDKNLSDEYKDNLSKYITTDIKELSDSLFIIKNGIKGSGIVLNGELVDNFDDGQIKKYQLVKNDIKHFDLKLSDNIIIKDVYVTHKKKTEGTLKIWPKEWDKIIVINKDQKEFPNYPDFGNQGAYIIKDENLNNFKDIISQTIKNAVGENDLVYQIFNNNDPFKFMAEKHKNGSDSEKLKISQNLANVLSEPLSILAVLVNKDNVLDKILDDIKIEGEEVDHKDIKISNIAIPISQNFKLADFFVQFSHNDVNYGMPISVKSGHKKSDHGNMASFMRYLGFDQEFPKSAPKNNIKSSAYEAFLSLYLQSIKNDKSKSINKLSDLTNLDATLGKQITENDINKIQEFVLDCVEYSYINDAKEIRKNPDLKDTLYNAYKRIIDGVNKDLYDELNSLQGNENFIEKMIIHIFKLSNHILGRLKRMIGISAKCHKITIMSDGTCSCVQQDENTKANIILKAQSGGRGYDIKFNNGKINGYSFNGKQSNGQFLCYSFVE